MTSWPPIHVFDQLAKMAHSGFSLYKGPEEVLVHTVQIGHKLGISMMGMNII